MKNSSSFFPRPGVRAGGLAAGFSLALAGSLCAQSLQVTTVAGYAGGGSADGAGSTVLMANPQGVALDAAGNIYVADTGNNVVRVITPGGVSSTLAGSGVAGSADGLGTNALFNQPCGIALDAAGNVYVSDFGSSVIRKITGNMVTTIAGSANVTGSANNTGTNATFFHPMGLAVDAATNVYVADYGNHLIRKIAPGNIVTTLAGQAGVFGSANGSSSVALFYEPEAVTVDGSGNVYVADTGNAAIRQITSGTVTTLAGSPGSLGSTDGTGTNALFYQPAGLAISSSGILYVSDYFNNTLRTVTTGGTVTTLAGLAGTTGSADGASSSARFWAPQGVAVNNNAALIYIADSANSAVRVLTPAGAVTTLAGSPSEGNINGATSSARFYAPQNVAIDSANNVYVADTRNSVIRKISASGVVSVLAGVPGVFGSADGAAASALFSGPQGIAVDGSGHVYVADTGNSTIRVITGGSVTTIAGQAGLPGVYDGAGTNAQFNQPEGIAVDGSGNLYVADTWNHTLRVISGGTVTTLAGLAGTAGTFDGTNAQARFNNPCGVAVDGSGNIYVTDFNNDTIRLVTPAGVVSTIAGWPGIWGATDGTGTNALFNGPSGISLDPGGHLFIVDSANQTVRKLTSSGTNWTSSTVAGTAGLSGSANGTGSAAQFYYPAGVAVSALGYVYIADSGNNTIRSQAIPPYILTQPQSQTITTGSSTVFSVAAYGSTPFTYTWQLNGIGYLTNTSGSLLASNAGSYTVQISNLAGLTNSAIATLTLTNGTTGTNGSFQTISRLVNGSVLFSLSGTSGATYTLQVSTNLMAWSNLTTFTMTNGAIQLTDPTATNIPTQFYRLVSP